MVDQTPPVPAGTWVWVPREPTEAMVAPYRGLYRTRISSNTAKAMWAEMIAAAPSPMVDDCPNPKGCMYCAQFGCPRLGSMVEGIDVEELEKVALAASARPYPCTPEFSAMRRAQEKFQAICTPRVVLALISAGRPTSGS